MERLSIMLIITYDFANDQTRSKFAKFLKKYGSMIQYSVYTIKNSQRIKNIIKNEIEQKFKKKFEETDSIMIFETCCACQKKVIKYGCATHEDKSVIFFDY